MGYRGKLERGALREKGIPEGSWEAFLFFEEKIFSVVLSHTSTEDGVVTADGGTDLVVLLLGVADSVELRGGSEHGTTEPNGVALHAVGDDLDLDGGGLEATAGELLGELNASLDSALQVAFDTTTEILEHGGTTGEDDVLVQATADVDGAVLDDVVDDGGEGDGEVGGEDFRVEEDLRTQEALVTNVNLVGLLGHLVHAILHAEPLVRLRIILGEFLRDIGAHVAVLLLHTLSNLPRLGRGNGFKTVTVQGLHKRRNIATSQGDVLNRATNHITFRHRNHVRHTIS